MNIITNLTFTIIVVVALVTNLMTLPLLKLFAAHEPLGGRVPSPAAEQASA